ncbi:hypothetical protein C1144_11025 [Clostridium botulinum]|nr:hypothetical protein C1144_11025 [Clostridium botulinum]
MFNLGFKKIINYEFGKHTYKYIKGILENWKINGGVMENKKVKGGDFDDTKNEHKKNNEGDK